MEPLLRNHHQHHLHHCWEAITITASRKTPSHQDKLEQSSTMHQSCVSLPLTPCTDLKPNYFAVLWTYLYISYATASATKGITEDSPINLINFVSFDQNSLENWRESKNCIFQNCVNISVSSFSWSLCWGLHELVTKQSGLPSRWSGCPSTAGVLSQILQLSRITCRIAIPYNRHFAHLHKFLRHRIPHFSLP